MFSVKAPLLQDGAVVLRQARLDWTLGQSPLPPSSAPSFEVGFGGADSEGPAAPLIGGEGMGQGTRGWGLGLQGRYVRGPWSFSATALALRNQGHSRGVLQRFSLAFQSEGGWRLALEQAPFAWGSGLNGGEVLGDGAHSFPRVSLITPDLDLPFGRGRLEAFLGRLEGSRPIPEWLPDAGARRAAQAAGLDVSGPRLRGALLRTALGAHVEASLGALTLEGGEDAQRRPAPAHAARTQSLAELRVRIPALASFLHARGASVYASRGGAPESRAMTLSPARHLGGLQVVWEGWDLGLEYAGASPARAPETFSQPAHLAGFSTHGDLLGLAFGRDTLTRTVDLGLPLFLEGRGRLKAVRGSAANPSEGGFWFLQAEAQWRTLTGKVGGSLASRRLDAPGASPRWGWTVSVFQAFRVF